MFSAIEEKSFFAQKVKIKKIFSNSEIKLYYFFHQKTKIYPNNIITIGRFIFFFVKGENYFKANRFLKTIRIQLKDKKVLIISSETTLIKLLFSFFPDTYIHDVRLYKKKNTGKRLINVIFLFYEDRRIAIGRSGDYIKIVNKIFEKYIDLENINDTIEIKCVFVNPKCQRDKILS
ncbi:MAG: hypothetical protein ACFFAN_18150 [Promethearchaeota archaeon]